jgi:hypothetical protein
MFETAATTTAAAGSPGTAGWLSAGIGAVGSIGSALLGGGSNAQPTTVVVEQKSNNTMLYVIGGIILIAVLYFVFKGKK